MYSQYASSDNLEPAMLNERKMKRMKEPDIRYRMKVKT